MAEGVAAQAGYDVLKSLVTEWLWPRIKCHVDYWRCFRRNVQGLRDEIDRLKNERLHMDQNVEEALYDTPPTEVQVWSKDGDQKLEDAARILSGCDGLKAWNIISRYSRGKRAKKTADKIALLRNRAIEIRKSVLSRTAATASIPHEPAMEFDSRRLIEDDIMRCLNDVCMVAICGAGGVGKTTVVKIIENRVREEKLFDEVVHVVVSQKIDKFEIQKKIAELLGLKFIDDTLDARAHVLRMRLHDSKRKLIVFDDVWAYFELKDIGVPLGNGFTRCKIILTSRVTDACKKMGAQKIIPMDVLTKEEAWNLFKEKAGSGVEDPDILPIAKDVAAECKGLPIALVTVGKALQDKGIHVWKDSLSQLRTSIPTDFPDVIEHVYTPLKLSYDFLINESVKSFLLLCCMFPEDYDIPIEHLNFYGIGLDIFERITNIDEGRNRTHNFVEQLKSRFLLLDGNRRHSVKMHDVVRDVAIFIGSNEMNGFLKCLEVSSMDFSSKDLSGNCTWMSIDFRIEIDKLFVGSNFPNLRLLMIRASASYYGNIICFEGMKGLNMLSISDKDLRAFLPTLKWLEKLRALHLTLCTVVDISVLGELASLEILCIHRCFGIEVLPADIGRLNRLKLLELISCGRLEKIAVGVISSLVRLEALKIIDSKSLKWEAKGSQSEERKAGLSELESLRSLTSLEIDIFDNNLFAEQICLSKQLVRYKINYVSRYSPPRYSSYQRREYDRSIRLYLPGEVTLGNWILHLLRSTQALQSEGDGSNNLIFAEMESLRSLDIRHCSTMKKLVYGKDCKLPVLVHLKLIELTELEEIVDGTIPEGSNSFQRLESLDVQQLPKLAHLWKGQNQNNWLGNLKSIFIVGCPKLCYLFSVATARSLVQLQSFEIRECERMEQVFWDEMESNTDASIMKFPKLEKLILSDLPRLKSVLPLDLEASHDNHSLHLFCNPKVETPSLRDIRFQNLQDTINKIWCCHVPINFFHNLKTLYIKDINSINNLISFSIAENLVNLKYLAIVECQEMVHVIEDEKEVSATHLFRNLEGIIIESSHKLRSFCQSKQTLELLSLKEVEIIDCPGMETFTLGSLSTPYLSYFTLDYEQVETKDLNGSIRDRFRIKNENKEEHEHSFEDKKEEEEIEEKEGKIE